MKINLLEVVFITMIDNNFILELNQLSVDITKISDVWIDENKPSTTNIINGNYYPGTMKMGYPTDPVLYEFAKKFNKKLFDNNFKFMIIQLRPGEELVPHIDQRRNASINLIIRGDVKSTPIRYYNDNKAINPIYEYYYNNYPVIISTKQFHGSKNETNVERILFSIDISPEYTFSQLKEQWLNNKNFFIDN